MSISKTVNSYLDNHNVQYELVHHPRAYTCLATARSAHINEDHIAKAVIVKDKMGYAMVVLAGSDKVKMHALQDEVNRDFELAEEADLNKLFADCQVGAIPPFGQAYGVETYLDERLNSLANIYFEAGDHENLVHVYGNEFHELFKGVRHGHFSH